MDHVIFTRSVALLFHNHLRQKDGAYHSPFCIMNNFNEVRYH